MKFKKYLFAGELPYFAAAIFAASGFLAGQQFSTPTAKVAYAERGAIVLNAVLDRAGQSDESLQDEVVEPIKSVLQRYADLGYVVIDTSKDDSGNMAIAALPADAIDITEIMRKAIATKPAPAVDMATPAPAAPSHEQAK